MCPQCGHFSWAAETISSDPDKTKSKNLEEPIKNIENAPKSQHYKS
jgi:uncharacterized Zn finger protein (UPF0148 family)